MCVLMGGGLSESSILEGLDSSARVFGVVASDPRELKIDRDEVCFGDGFQDVQELGWKVMSIHIHRDKRYVFQLLKMMLICARKTPGRYIYVSNLSKLLGIREV